MSATSIQAILHEHRKKDLFSLYPAQFDNRSKKVRIDWSKEMLEKYDRGASNNVYKIVTGDESGIYAYEPETKQQSIVWSFEGKPNPMKVIRGRSNSN